MYDLWNSLHTFGNHIGLFASLFDMFISVHISEQEPLSSVLLNECVCVYRCVSACYSGALFYAGILRCRIKVISLSAIYKNPLWLCV